MAKSWPKSPESLLLDAAELFRGGVDIGLSVCLADSWMGVDVVAGAAAGIILALPDMFVMSLIW